MAAFCLAPFWKRTQISFFLSSIFLIFSLNASALSVIYNNTDIILPLDPPDTLQRLFKFFTSWYPPTIKFPFFSPVVRHTKIKKSTKGSFLVSTIAHTIYLTTTCVVVALIAPQARYKAQKVKNTSSSFNSAEDPFHTSFKCFLNYLEIRKPNSYVKIHGYQ